MTGPTSGGEAHFPSGIGNAMGGYDCACGETWLGSKGRCTATPDSTVIEYTSDDSDLIDDDLDGPTSGGEACLAPEDKSGCAGICQGPWKYACPTCPAPIAPDNAGLREALMWALEEAWGYLPDLALASECSPVLADALLSGPLAALLAERDDLAAQVAACTCGGAR